MFLTDCHFHEKIVVREDKNTQGYGRQPTLRILIFGSPRNIIFKDEAESFTGTLTRIVQSWGNRESLMNLSVPLAHSLCQSVRVAPVTGV